MFISFEGIDGCGKTTQLSLIKKYFEYRGFDVVAIREPGGTILSEAIRNILLNSDENIHPITELLLFEASRSHLVNSIVLPALADNKIVLCDRFFDSTTAYQGYGRNIDLKSVEFLNNLAANNLKPDITFFLTLDFETARQRAKTHQKDRIESSDRAFFEQTLHGFQEISKKEPERVKIINAGGSIEQTQNLIIAEINKLKF